MLLMLAAVPLSVLAQSGEDFSSFEERMTGREFTAAGLHKLSDEELAALNEWVRQRSLGEADIAALQEAQAQEMALTDIRLMPDEPFTSSIVGTFNGWEGGSQFTLANGMVWEQTGEDRYATRVLDNPEVTLRPGFLGNWTLQVEGYNKRTNVRRIK